MRKLTLNLDALAVDSFATDAAERGRGTVRAHGNTRNQYTCAFTCGESCLVCPVPTEPYESCKIACGLTPPTDPV